MSTQILFCHGTLGTGTINSAFLCGNFVSAGTLESVPTAGDFSDWFMQLTVAPGGATSRTYTIQKNGSNTALTLTISGSATTGSYTGSAVSFSAGDTIRCVQTTSGSPAASTQTSSIAFTPTTPNECIHGWFSPTNPSLNNFHPIFYGRSAGGFANTHRQSNVMALAGTISKHRMTLNTAPGSGKSHTFALRKNTTVQDGSGGTVDTRVTISDTNTVAEATFSLSVSIGDVVDVAYTANSGTPANPVNEVGSIVFTPSVAGAFQVCQTGPDLDITNQEFSWPNDINVNWTTTQVTQIGHASQPKLTHLEVSAAITPGGGSKQYTFSVQRNGTDVLSAVLGPSATTCSADATGDGTPFSETQGLQLSSLPANSPTSNNATRFSIAFNGKAPLSPDPAVLSLTGQTLTAFMDARPSPSAGALAFTGTAPFFAFGMALPAGAILMTGQTPTLVRTGSAEICVPFVELWC